MKFPEQDAQDFGHTGRGKAIGHGPGFRAHGGVRAASDQAIAKRPLEPTAQAVAP